MSYFAFLLNGTQQFQIVPRQQFITATHFAVPGSNFTHYLDIGLSSLAARVLGGTLVTTEHLLAGGRTNFKPIPWTIPCRVNTLSVYWSTAAREKHDPLWKFVLACSKTSKDFKCSVRFRVIEEVSELQRFLMPTLLPKFRWVLTRTEHAAAAEFLHAILGQPSNSPGIQNALVGASDFVRSLGLLR